MKKRKPETFREKLSITQQHLAEYLGISRSLLSLYEKGLRNLSPSAALKLSQLELSYYKLQNQKNKKKAPVHPHLEKHLVKTKKNLKSHAENCSYKKIMAERQLEKMAKEHAKALVLMELLDAMDYSPKTKETGIDQLWIAVQKNEAIRKMIRSGDAAQATIQARILSLEAESAVYERFHSKI